MPTAQLEYFNFAINRKKTNITRVNSSSIVLESEPLEEVGQALIIRFPTAEQDLEL